MMSGDWNDLTFFSFQNMSPSLIIFLIWSLVWKGPALWRSAQRRERGWFSAFFLLNTIGILEILYLFIFSKKQRPVISSNKPKG